VPNVVDQDQFSNQQRIYGDARGNGDCRFGSLLITKFDVEGRVW
jgi:hypothetical protein